MGESLHRDLGDLRLVLRFPVVLPTFHCEKVATRNARASIRAALGESVALSLGLTLIGVWFFASAFANAIYWLVLVIHSKQMNDIPMEWTDKQIASMIEVAVQFLLSLWLIFGSAGIRRIVYRFRYGATDATEP